MGVGITVEVEESEGKYILRVSGRIDAATAPLLERKIEEQMEAKHLRLLLDLSGVDYLSSAGMRLLLAATKKMKAREGVLAMSGIVDEVMEIIKMAGFERILNLYPNEKQALDSL